MRWPRPLPRAAYLRERGLGALQSRAGRGIAPGQHCRSKKKGFSLASTIALPRIRAEGNVGDRIEHSKLYLAGVARGMFHHRAMTLCRADPCRGYCRYGRM